MRRGLPSFASALVEWAEAEGEVEFFREAALGLVAAAANEIGGRENILIATIGAAGANGQQARQPQDLLQMCEGKAFGARDDIGLQFIGELGKIRGEE